MHYIKGLLLALVCFTVISCNNTTPAEEAQTGNTTDFETTDMPQSFREFYEKFHQDSVYQINHITFPLTGMRTQLDSLDTRPLNYWPKEDWQYQRGIDLGKIFKREFLKIEEEVIIEYIRHKEANFQMERRFAVISGEWHLIYFVEMRQFE